MVAVANPTYETTLHVRDSCLCLHVQRAARALARRFDDALRPLGLTNGQFSLMISLNRPKPPGMAAVASLLAIDRSTLTAALKPLPRRRRGTSARWRFRSPPEQFTRTFLIIPRGRESSRPLPCRALRTSAGEFLKDVKQQFRPESWVS